MAFPPPFLADFLAKLKATFDPSGLPPRKETFLARYPRPYKVSAAFCAALFCLALGIALAPGPHDASRFVPPATPTIEGADAVAARANAPVHMTDISGARIGNQSGNTVVNEQNDLSIKMAPAPDIGVTEDTPEGSLPRIGEDGRQPWQVYARPFDTADKRPRIAIVIVDLGLSRVVTDAAINRMPANVTLAFDAQSPVVGAWLGRARQAGHETILMVPMEPFDFPRSDPGPDTLLTSLPNSDNLGRLFWALRQGTGYVGIMTLSGSRFTTSPDKLTPLLDALRRRGLMIIDARVAPHSAILDMARNLHVPAVGITGRIDQNPSPDDIDTALSQLEKTARLTGRAVGITSPLPVVLDRLQEWLKTLPQDGLALAPISAMVQ